jgi:hypothetical protein
MSSFGISSGNKKDVISMTVFAAVPIPSLIDSWHTLQDEVGLKQVIEILTRFSLFQSTRGDSLSVHRLVQEVVRDSINNEDKHIILLNAMRMDPFTHWFLTYVINI